MIQQQYQILKPFAEKPWQRLTFRQVQQYSKKKSESFVYNALKKFSKSSILKEEKAGNVTLYSLSLNSTKARAYAGFVAEYIAWSNKHLPFSNLESMASKIPTKFFALIITGSYASNTQKKDSDIDAIIICDDAVEPKKIIAELSYEAEISIPKIHLYVFTKSEFSQMLLSTKQNFGKETAKNNLILYGGEIYFNIMSEVIRNGFNG